jgi:type II secretory ATPase GspE/PulE/Tfp pilus assembly ATPase PilB-like protein
LLSAEQLDAAVAAAQQTRKALPAVLIERGWIAEAEILKILARQQGWRFVTLKELSIPAQAVRAVPPRLAAYYSIMPVDFAEGVLTVAVSNPLELAAIEDLESTLGLKVERVLACRDDILEALRRYYGVGADTVERILSSSPPGEETAPREESHDIGRMAEDASVVRLVNQLFQEAIKARATDIHFEVYRDGIVVRRRIDGVLYDTTVPRNIRLLYPAIVSRIKLMSGLNIVERRLPQDGRTRVKVGHSEYDLRISVVPSLHGEDIVVRILPATMLFDLSQLGFSDAHLGALQEYIARPHGIIFVTGPTGSGKSTTLYACLSRLNTRERKIITIEDPVEYELKGITQTQVKSEIGLTFARALRSMLRHDPDVMMVGEVRDRETAEIAVQTAMTGHLVLSTLHTNDAAGGAVRLSDMGIDPYLITSTVLLFTAQRLIRVICRSCREGYEREGRTLYRGRGCRECNQSGYRGRLAINEFLPLTPELQDLILRRASAKMIREKADALGMATLAADGLQKVAQGVTTAEEVLRVTSL